MTGRLTLLCCGATEGTRRGVFPRDEPLETGAAERARALAGSLPRADRIWRSPALRAAQTAQAAGLLGEVVEALRDQDFGRWAGSRPGELDRRDVALWMSDPACAPHGGESLAALRQRVAALLAELRLASGHTIAVTHAAVIRAAVCEVLGAPAQAFWAVDVEPLGIVRLTCDGRRWALRMKAAG